MTLVRVVGLSAFLVAEFDEEGGVLRLSETRRGQTVDVTDETMLERALRRGWVELADAGSALTVGEALKALDNMTAKELDGAGARLGLRFTKTAKKTDKIDAIVAARASTPVGPSDLLDVMTDDELLERAVELDIEPGEDRAAMITAIREHLAAPPPVGE